MPAVGSGRSDHDSASSVRGRDPEQLLLDDVGDLADPALEDGRLLQHRRLDPVVAVARGQVVGEPLEARPGGRLGRQQVAGAASGAEGGHQPWSLGRREPDGRLVPQPRSHDGDGEGPRVRVPSGGATGDRRALRKPQRPDLPAHPPFVPPEGAAGRPTSPDAARRDQRTGSIVGSAAGRDERGRGARRWSGARGESGETRRWAGDRGQPRSRWTLMTSLRVSMRLMTRASWDTDWTWSVAVTTAV